MMINLDKYRGKGSRVFSGREEGKKTRKILQLDQLDNKNENIIIKIPENTLSFNTSFFLGMFGNSIRELGEENFKLKYNFECKDVIRKSIDDGILRALRNTDPLG